MSKRNHIPTDEELTQDEIAYRNEKDPHHTLNINQLRYRTEQQKRNQAAKAEKQQRLAVKEEARKKIKEEQQRQKMEEKLRKQLEKEYAATSESSQEIPDDDDQTDRKMSLEQYLETAHNISDVADVDDLTKILHARLVLESQNLTLRPQDYISAIRMLRDIKLADNPPEVPDPYALEQQSREELCQTFTEAISAHFHIWLSAHKMAHAKWMLPVIAQFFRMIFLDQPYEGLLQRISETVESIYDETAHAPTES